MGKLWKVKTARIKGDNLVIVAEKEIPLAKILDHEVLEDEPHYRGEPSEPEEEEEVSEEEEEAISADPEEVMEQAEVVQDKIEEGGMVSGGPVSKLKGQKGRVLASLEAGNSVLAEISEDTKIGYGSVSGQLSWLVKNGFAKRVNQGQYEITAKGRKYLQKLEAA